jgi:hypothetical protein
MSVTTSDIETADRLSRRRARLLPVLAILFLAQQASYFAEPEQSVRLVDHVKIGAWLILSIVLLLALGTGGFWLKPKKVRELMDDELSRANRLRAQALGFWMAAGAAIGLYIVNMFEAVSARESIHIILTSAIAGALLMFGLLERRMLKDG